MNTGELHRKLIAAARACPPSDRVPWGFEKRIMARLAAAPVNPLALWAKAMWRGAACCVGVLVIVSAWAAVTPRHRTASVDLTQDFESTLLAAVNPSDEQ
jgi:hypothetical protein